MKILKKDGRLENYDFNKIKIAVQKSAAPDGWAATA